MPDRLRRPDFEAAALALGTALGRGSAATVEPVESGTGFPVRTGNAAAFGGRRMAAAWRAETNRELGGAVVARGRPSCYTGPMTVRFRERLHGGRYPCGGARGSWRSTVDPERAGMPCWFRPVLC